MEAEVRQEDKTSSKASAESRALDVAILERPNDSVFETVGLADEANLPLKSLKDESDYHAVYGDGPGPDVLLVPIDADDAFEAARRIIALAPACAVVIFGHDITVVTLSRAMSLGARRNLQHPFTAEELVEAVEGAADEIKPLVEKVRLISAATHEAVEEPRQSKVLTVFSPKGGVGTSTLAVNVACALSKMGRRVVIVDGNISFGNIGVFLNITPSKNMLQLIGDPAGITEASVMDTLLPHSSGVKVLLAPLKPEEAENVHGDHLRTIIAILQKQFDYVVVDTWPSYDERVLAMLESAHQVLLPLGPELPSVKNVAAFLRVTRLLNYPKDKLVPILMRADSVPPSHLRDLETFLKQPLTWRIVSDGRRVTSSINTGQPFVLSSPTAAVSQNVFALAEMIDGTVVSTQSASAEASAQSGQPFWKRMRFNLGKAS